MPILDLSYRGYDGPLAPPSMRWWVIARALLSGVFAKRSYWVYTMLGGLYYVVMMIVVFAVEQIASSTRDSGFNITDLFARVVWKDQFLHGLSTSQIWFLAITLLIGAGSIANDNRTNALLVYLSKPCSKLDYILGKFIGIFLALLLAMVLPTAVFLLYGSLSYRQYGFFREDPYAIARLLMALPLCAMFYTSLILGFSSLFRHGRIAGATFAGVYFLTNFFTKIMQGSWVVQSRLEREGGTADVKPLVGKLFYGSIDGLNIGLMKATLQTDGSPMWLIRGPNYAVQAPSLGWMIGILLVISFLSLVVAWRRVRAVEVVG